MELEEGVIIPAPFIIPERKKGQSCRSMFHLCW